MIYLILAILCSSGVSLSIRYAEQHSGRMKSVTVVNYIASVFWCFYFLPDKHLYPVADGQAFVLVLSIINGCLYLGTLLLQQVNIRKNGTTISASFSHMGVLVPTVLSIFLFGEYPGRLQWVGVALALAAILILNIQGRADKEKAREPLLILYFCDRINFKRCVDGVYKRMAFIQRSGLWTCYEKLVRRRFTIRCTGVQIKFLQVFHSRTFCSIIYISFMNETGM